MSQTLKAGPGFFYGWIIVAIGATLTFFGTGFYSYSRGVFLPSLAEALADGSRFAIAMGFSAASVTSALSAPYLGHILDRSSPRRVILVGIILVSTSYLLLSVCQTLWQFYAIVGVGMGLGMSCMGALAWHKTLINWFDHWRGRAIALGVLGASLAGVVMPPLVILLVEMIGWRGGFATFACIVILILTPLVAWLLVDRPEDMGEVRDGLAYRERSKTTESETEGRVWHWQQLLRYPSVWALVAIFGAMACVYSAMMLHLFGHLTDVGIHPGEAALVLSATALFAALGKPLIGWMSDSYGARVTVWVALVCQILALLMFVFAADFSSALLAGCAYGFGYSGMSPLRTFALSVAVGRTSFGSANGLLRVLELPLVISASPLAGYIYDTTGSYQLAFLILAALLGLVCICPCFIQAGGARERRRLAVHEPGKSGQSS